MHPYGSKKRTGYDTEPRIKAARAVEKRRGEELASEQLEADSDAYGGCWYCDADEIERAFACWDAQLLAESLGEAYECYCVRPACTHR